MLGTSSCSIILTVERGKLESQAVLLVDSIRTFGGVYSNIPIYAISPRPSRQMSKACIKVLKSMGVQVIIEDILTGSENYGSIARLATCAWSEKNVPSEILVSLDDDMVLIQEPDFSLQGTDLFVRPVDVKGMCTTGPDDLFDPYWRKISQACSVEYERIPWIETTVDRIHVKASYNGGMIVVRRKLGLFQTAYSMYHILKQNDLSPRSSNTQEVFASTGFVGDEASRWWGSSQAVISLAATQLDARITIAPPIYNVPAHLIQHGENIGYKINLQGAILLHYHWLFYKAFLKEMMLLDGENVLPGSVIDWLKIRIPLDEKYSWRSYIRRNVLRRNYRIG